ncbi:hypothetical protein [Methylophaga frappieri]|uniref:hypothetical protein n=1 Tax=Methylophaga frappieri (strain ATCC BAA-2434 / DSM 25690 / JAM7) TaxID=754477 RepID=UPI00059BD83B|nr:hypothetical protein [Methylophaga frappieri]
MTAQGSYSWAQDMPKHCPLTGSIPTTGILFRIVYNSPPDDDDFLMTVDDPHQIHYGFRDECGELSERFGDLPKDKQCDAFATSHFDNIKNCRRIAIHKNRTANVKIAEVNLKPSLGVMKETRPNHFSVWFDVSAQPWSCVVKIHPV